jgi:hypothetical protein
MCESADLEMGEFLGLGIWECEWGYGYGNLAGNHYFFMLLFLLPQGGNPEPSVASNA